MTHQEINEAIAEAYGFTREEDYLDGRQCWTYKGGNVCEFTEVPEFCNDLNAMHDAEKVLVREQRFAYWHELNNIVMGTVHVAFATAAQRAEAFLKTLNLWK